MFWEVDDIMNGAMEYYEFLSSKYQESVSTNRIYQVRDNDSKTIVIDGQQRLTSLWISLYGSYTLEKGKNEMYLYLNLDAPDNSNDSEDDSINSTASYYNFRFMTEYKFKNCIANGEHWIRVSDAYAQNFNAISYILSNQLAENEFAIETLEKLLSVFKDENIINAYEIQGEDLDHVLNIFVRTNSGGKPLSKGDLLLSVITVNWAGSNNVNAREYVQDIVNKVAEYGYKVDKDWVLSCILYILDKDIKLCKEQEYERFAILNFNKYHNETFTEHQGNPDFTYSDPQFAPTDEQKKIVDEQIQYYGEKPERWSENEKDN